MAPGAPSLKVSSVLFQRVVLV